MELAEIKSRWNDVLDLLERENRVAWLAFFDARLVSFNNNELKLSFIDAEKLSGAHNYAQVIVLPKDFARKAFPKFR